jgi:hypothetical protein
VKSHEPACPFCGQVLAPTTSGPAPGRATKRISRAAWLALGSAAMTGCTGGQVASRAGESPTDASVRDASGSETTAVRDALATDDAADGAGQTSDPADAADARALEAGPIGLPCGGLTCEAGAEFCVVFYGCETYEVPSGPEPQCVSIASCGEAGAGFNCPDIAPGNNSCYPIDDSGLSFTSSADCNPCYGAPPARLERLRASS